jgi:hypothetical protein
MIQNFTAYKMTYPLESISSESWCLLNMFESSVHGAQTH